MCASNTCVNPSRPGGGGSGGSSPAATTSDPNQLCQGACGRLNGCDPRKDLQTCRNQCLNVHLLRFTRMRADVLADSTTCISKKDCATVLNDIDDALEKCIDEAAATRAPTQGVIDVCTRLEEAYQRLCGVTLNKSSCFNALKVYNDTVIRETSDCVGKGSCQAVKDCFNAALGYKALK